MSYNPIPADRGDRHVSIHPNEYGEADLFFVTLSDFRSRDIAVTRQALIAGLKRAGITAEDFKEPTAQDIARSLPVGAVFTRNRHYTNGREVREKRTFLKVPTGYSILDSQTGTPPTRVVSLNRVFDGPNGRPASDITVIYPSEG